ncbi:MAG TPA: CdaR family protein [Vicinamibacteria bacterium]|nr:CdaR family protein [Vicinamibacteria bacterium]
MRGLLDNLPLKLISVSLAVLLWFVIGEKTSERGLSVPVELQNVPRDLELVGEPTNVVDVRVRASPSVIQRLTPGDVSAQIDLGGVREGEHIIHLTSGDIRVPFGVRVVKITPSIITMGFERTLQKTVPIRPRLLGRPGAGFEVAEVTAEPAEVRVAGPRSRVQEMESAYTEPVSVEGATSTVVETVNLGLDDPVLRIQGSPRVRVTARVREVQETRALENVEVEVRGGDFPVSPARVRVVLTGPASALARVKPAEVHAYVEAARVKDNSVRVSVEMSPGQAGVTLKEAVPPSVSVRPPPRRRR